MKIIAERAALLRAVGRVQGVVERRNTIPILDNLMLSVENSADGAVMTVSGTDMDMEMTASVKVQATGTGKTTVPAATLHDILKKLPDGCQVELDGPTDGLMKLRAGKSTFKLHAMPSEDYPTLIRGDMKHNFSVPAAGLLSILERTRFCVSTEETRYYLQGIYLHAPNGGTDGVLRGVSTDGHRLAQTGIPLPDGAAGMPGVIIPRKAIGEMVKLLDGVDGDVEMSISEAKIQLWVTGSVFLTKVIDGTFPDYTRVIPSGNDKLIDIDRDAFVDAVGRVTTVSSEKARSMRLEVVPGSATLTVNDATRGQAVEEIEARYQGDPIEVGFNSRYLAEILGHVGETARLEVADGMSPVLFKDPNGSPETLYVLMPMRV